MSNPSFYAAYLARLKVISKELAIDMAYGTLEDHASYKEMCGIIKGIDRAYGEFEDMVKQQLKEESEK